MSNRRWLRWLEAALVLTGLAAAGAFLWLQFEQRYFQAGYKDQLTYSAVQLDGAHAEPGTPYGRLRAERIGLDVAVLRGVDAKTLRRAAGVVPVSRSNVAIAAHRDTFFRNIGELRRGDRLELDTAAGGHAYEVAWSRVVEPEEISVLGATGRAELTLITCYPFHYIGPAPQRYVVRAHRVR